MVMDDDGCRERDAGAATNGTQGGGTATAVVGRVGRAVAVAQPKTISVSASGISLTSSSERVKVNVKTRFLFLVLRKH